MEVPSNFWYFFDQPFTDSAYHLNVASKIMNTIHILLCTDNRMFINLYESLDRSRVTMQLLALEKFRNRDTQKGI